jgi:hypothetical protein
MQHAVNKVVVPHRIDFDARWRSVRSPVRRFLLMPRCFHVRIVWPGVALRLRQIAVADRKITQSK